MQPPRGKMLHSVLQVENIWTFQKGAGVVTVTPFQATNRVLDGAGLVSPVTKKKEKLVLALYVYHDHSRETKPGAVKVTFYITKQKK